MNSANTHFLLAHGEMTMMVEVGEKITNTSEPLSLSSWSSRISSFLERSVFSVA